MSLTNIYVYLRLFFLFILCCLMFTWGLGLFIRKDKVNEWLRNISNKEGLEDNIPGRHGLHFCYHSSRLSYYILRLDNKWGRWRKTDDTEPRWDRRSETSDRDEVKRENNEGRYGRKKEGNSRSRWYLCPYLLSHHVYVSSSFPPHPSLRSQIVNRNGGKIVPVPRQ